MTKFSVREQVNTLTLDDLTPIQIKSALGKTFSNQEQHADHANAVDLVKAYQAVHVPTLGQAIPGTGAIKTATASSVGDIVTIHQPAAGETFQLMRPKIKHDGTGILTSSLVLTDGSNSVVIAKIENAPAAQVNAFGNSAKGVLQYDSNMYLGAVVDVAAGGGAAGDADFAAAVMKVVQ